MPTGITVRQRSGVLTLLALLSGSCALAYEVLYVRALTTILGDMFYVHAALLTTFLVGIGLGAKLARRCFRQLWLFELLTGLYALGLPLFLKWFSRQPLILPISSNAYLIILAAIGLLAIPSCCIGFSIPLFSAYIKSGQADKLAFHGIYKFYNLGAIFSIIGVEFFLIEHVGISVSLAIIGAVNILNGLVLLRLRTQTLETPERRPHNFPRHIIAALALASLASAVFQMFFLKLTYLFFLPHRENFALALSVTLLGLFLGTVLVEKTKLRFATLTLLAAFSIGLIFANLIPILKLYDATRSLSAHSPLLIFGHKFIFTCVFALIPMTCFGATIPALMRTEGEVAGESGHLLWVASLANAAGYLFYVLCGQPFLKVHGLLILVAAAAIVSSLLAVRLHWSRIQKVLFLLSISLLTVLVLSWKEEKFYLAPWYYFLEPTDRITIYKSGAESVAMVESAQRTWVSYNGHPGMTVKERGIVNPGELMCGVIPALYAPRLEQALVLGHGTGITSGTAAHIFKHTDVVEINQAFYLMTPDVKYANFDIMDNPAAKLHLADGRAFLVDKKERYDVIINSISAPTYFTASKIYTLEFYDRVQTALKPDGIFCTWLSSHDMSAEGVDTVLSALHQNFRYCNLSVMRLGYYLAVCSNEPVETRRFSELSMPEAAVNELQKAMPGLDLDSFFEDIRISENVFDHYQPDVPHENTDDRPVLEFMVFRSFKEGNMGEDPFLTRQKLLNIDPVRMHQLKDQSELIRKAKAFFLVSPRYCTENFLPILNRHLPSMAQFLQWKSDHLNSKRTPDFGTEYDLGMVYLKLEQYDQAVVQFRKALKINPRHAQLHNSIGVALYFQQQLPEAIKHYEEALRLQPNYPRAQENRRKAWEQLKSDQRSGSEP